MARAEPVEVGPGEPFRRVGARAVEVRAQELFGHAAGALDVDGVHDMRVASRRLRAVLEVFRPCFPKAELEAVLAEVKALADALGERRDPDVHVLALEALADELPAAQRAGVRVMAERQRARQAAGDEVVEAALAEADRRDLKGRLLALAAEAGR